MRGLPVEWLHGKDELYHNLRGPGERLEILSSAYSDPKSRGSGHHEPLTYATTYGKGRCVVTTMGHFWERQTEWDSLHCVGFQTVLARSVEFVATGTVTLPVPAEFPRKDAVSIVTPSRVSWSTQSGRATRTRWKDRKEANELAPLTPAEAAEAFEIAEDLVIEAVASEPMVEHTAVEIVRAKIQLGAVG